MVTCNQCEDKEHQKVIIDFIVLDSDSVGAEQNHSHEFSLLSLESVLQHVAADAIVDWRLCKMRQISGNVLRNVLENLCSTVENMLLVDSLDIEYLVALVLLCNALFDERLTLARENSFVNNR